jgi:N-acetylneuraminic acid mutarotase
MTSALKLASIGVPCMAFILVSACGGGGSGPGNTITTYQVSATAGSGGSISPSSGMVNAGSTMTLTVTASSGYVVSSVTGCGGALTGNTYTTGTITANCAVTASFIAQYTVTGTAGAGGTISPASTTVNAGSTTMLTVTASSGYVVGSVTGCGGTISGSTYTTGAVNANCTVTASFIAQYTVTGSAGNGGTISPASSTVNAGGTSAFTVTPNSGYVISTVTGCGGTLSGNTYTTGTINANCAVTASFAAAFTWVGGSSTSDATGAYGIQGVAASSNVPSARHAPVTWNDAAGNLWFFGGYGVGSAIYNDLWKYSPASGEWTWVSGSNTANASGVYGTLGVAATMNVPGAHGSSVTWTDASGNLWMFAGYGYDSTGAQGWLNSLWKYSPSSGMWTWLGGSNTINATGVYGTRGVAAPANVPGAVAGGGWTDASGNVWLFGAYGYDSTGTLGRLNDLWMYSPSSGMWTWVSGSNTVNAIGVYGTQGVAAAANVPGARSAGGTWIDSSGNLWMFGGYGYDSTGATGYLNDLWEYSPSSGMWIWVGGSNTVTTQGSYGTQGVAAATNVPGPRYCGVPWTDANGNLWLLGGSGYGAPGAFGELNDLWKYTPSIGEWTWVGGSNTANANGVYGTQGVAGATNTPGARDCMVSWKAGGSVWLFGGEGYNFSGADPNAPEWNDLWKYPIQ